MNQAVRISAFPLPTEASTLPQRFINPLTAYLSAVFIQSPVLLFLQALGAGIASYWGPADDSMKILVAAMGADFLIGVLSAVRRRQFTVRQCWEGFVAKIMVTLLVLCVAYISSKIPNAAAVSTFVNYGFALIDAASTLKNFRRARIQLPGWMESAVVRVEKTLNSHVEEKIGPHRG